MRLRTPGLMLAVVTLLALAFAPCASAQVWPAAKPVQLVIPYPPGGSDALARKLIIGMGEKLGQTIVAVNKPGASTQIASAMVAQAAPDGYTLYFASPIDLAAGPALFKSLPFDALRDFTPISYVADAPYALVVNSSLAARTPAELIALVKTDPGKTRFASYGVQSSNDVTARHFNYLTGLVAEIIPYQGGSPSLAAIQRNEVQMMFATLIPTRAMIDGGQIRAVAMAAAKRVARYPDVPTLREAGIDLVDAAGFILLGPKGLPGDVVSKLHEALTVEMSKPEIIRFMDDLGVVRVGSTPAEAGARLTEMTAHWAGFAPKLGLEKQ